MHKSQILSSLGMVLVSSIIKFCAIIVLSNFRFIHISIVYDDFIILHIACYRDSSFNACHSLCSLTHQYQK